MVRPPFGVLRGLLCIVPKVLVALYNTDVVGFPWDVV